jgi:uncharacterized protein YggE
MKTALAVTFALLMIAAAALAQQPDARAVQANTLFVSAEGKFEAAPDTAVIQFNIAAQENTSQAAYDRASKAAEQVRGILRSNGIDPKQAHVGIFSLAPVYDWRTPQHKIVGYRVSTTVELKLKELAKVGPIVEQLASVGTAGDQTVSYTLEDADEAKVKAVEDAFRRAHLEAHALAQAGGRTLGEVSYASIDSVERTPVFAVQRAMMAKAAPSAEQPPTAEFTPQTVTVTAQVSILFTLK